MPLVVKDRVRETSTTAGTGTFTLAGAVLGYQSFSAIGNGNTTYYTIYLQGGNEWEVGIGTYTASGTTLSRDTILASSNGGSAVNFSAGVKDVFVTYPADRSVWYDTATNVTLNALTLSGGTANGVLYLNGSKVATSGSALTFNGSDVFGVSGAGTIYASVTNTLAGGSARLRLFNTGDTSDGFAIINNEGASGQVNVLNYKNSPLAFWTNSTEKIRLLGGAGTNLNIGGNFTSTNNTLQVTGNTAIGYTAAAPANGLIVSGDVGIGTDTPLYKAHAINNADAFRIVGMFENPNTGTSAQAAVRVKAGTNTATMGLGGSGVSGAAVYIGADQATPILYYTGNSYHYWQTATTEKMRLEQSGTLILRQSSNAANTSVSFNTTVQNALTLDSSGNLGVGSGAVTPARRLDVQSATAIPMRVGTGDSNMAIEYVSTLGTRYNWLTGAQYNINGGFEITPSTAVGNTTFTSPALVILGSSGNVGIGTTNPLTKLHVVKTGAGLQEVAYLSNEQTAAAGVGPRLTFLGGASIGMGTVEMAWDGAATTDAYLAFRTRGASNVTERVRIDSAGTVFMRDGASTTNTNSSRLVVGGTISETVSSTQYLVASQFDIGTAPNEIPLNQYLGNLAYQDSSAIAGQVGLSAGTAALPSLVSATDTDTGMWFPAANTLAWSTGGARAMTLDASGRLGIGQTNPTVPLEVAQSAVTYTQLRLANLSSGNNGGQVTFAGAVNVDIGWIKCNYPGEMLFGAYNTSVPGVVERARISSDGTFRVKGAGTAGSTDAVQFSGSAPANSLIVNSGGLLFVGGVTAQKAAEVARIGSPGIQSSILVDNSANTNGAFVGAFNDSALFGVNRNPSTGNFYDTSKYAADIFLVGSTTTSYIVFETSNAANSIPTERMRITATGEIGIGETNPASYGQVVIRKDTASGAGSSGASCLWFLNANTTANNASSIFFGDNATTAAGGINFINTDHTNEYGVITFDTRGSGGYGERVRITSGGYFKASNDGVYDSSTGAYHEVRQTANDLGFLVSATNSAFTSVALRTKVTATAAGTGFYHIDSLDSAATRIFGVRGDGNTYNTNGTFGTFSDQKLKQDIGDVESQWDDIKAIRFRKYRLKSQVAANPDAPALLGVVAQELEQTSPGLVDETPDRDADGNDLGTTTKSVKTSVLLMKAAVALQEAMARIEQLEAKVSALENKGA